MELGPAELGRAIGEVGHSGVTSKGWRRGCALHTGITAEVAMLRDLLKADENLPVQQR